MHGPSPITATAVSAHDLFLAVVVTLSAVAVISTPPFIVVDPRAPPMTVEEIELPSEVVVMSFPVATILALSLKSMPFELCARANVLTNRKADTLGIINVLIEKSFHSKLVQSKVTFKSTVMIAIKSDRLLVKNRS